MLTRRRFGAMAVAAMAVLPMRCVVAQNIPECRVGVAFGPFDLEAEINIDDESFFAVSLSEMIPAVNRGVRVNVMYLKVLRSFEGGGSSRQIVWAFSPDEDDRFMDPRDTGSYELFVGGERIIDYPLDPATPLYNVHIDEATFDDLMDLDTVVRLTLGGASYEWRVEGYRMHDAIFTARFHLDSLAAQYRNRACEPSDCLLTTVACRHVGLLDDCFELRTVRALRDRWLAKQVYGPAALDWYYATAPKILAAIPARDRAAVFARFYVGRLLPAVVAERVGLHRLAFRWLESGVRRLAARYLPMV